MSKYTSTLLAQGNTPEEIQKSSLDLLQKINEVSDDGDSLVAELGEVVQDLGTAVEGEFNKLNLFAQFQHNVPINVGSGTLSSGAWRTGPLTHTHLNEIEASLENNQFTLQKGKYKIDAFRCLFYVNAYATRLYNVTDDETTILGSNGYADIGDGYNSEYVPICGVFTIDKETTFEIQAYCQTTRAADGWGFSTNSIGGLDRCWANVLIEKLYVGE